MTSLELGALFIALLAAFGYVNARFIKLADAVGLAAFGMATALGAVVIGRFDPGRVAGARELVARLDFGTILLQGLLGPLLFAGSLQVNFEQMKRERRPVLALATGGVVLSTALVALGFYGAGQILGVDLPWIVCFVFGALISPTDPVAVLAVLRRVGVPASLETRIVAESLFNDGTGVVLFVTCLGILVPHGAPATWQSVVALFVEQSAGGVIAGAVLGACACFLLRTVDSYPVEILITLALSTAGYVGVAALGASAPLAMVVAGLWVGRLARSQTGSAHPTANAKLFEFWEIADELLNLVVFALIGLQLMVIEFPPHFLAMGVIAVFVVLIARWISVAIPVALSRRLRRTFGLTTAIMTWGGLRGGLSLAMAFSLPDVPGRSLVVTSCYAVVLASLFIQATTLQSAAAALLARARRGTEGGALPPVAAPELDHG